jgi:hypothetical protein
MAVGGLLCWGSIVVRIIVVQFNCPRGTYDHVNLLSWNSLLLKMFGKFTGHFGVTSELGSSFLNTAHEI